MYLELFYFHELFATGMGLSEGIVSAPSLQTFEIGFASIINKRHAGTLGVQHVMFVQSPAGRS